LNKPSLHYRRIVDAVIISTLDTPILMAK
jgi:hypothetical protein